MKRRTEAIEIEAGGLIYRGMRIVSGEHDLRQEVRFETLRQRDANDYDPDDEAFMRAIAKVMLRDLVEQWTVQGVRAPVKVRGAKGPSRRRRSAK